jgi:hypothetical protein
MASGQQASPTALRDAVTVAEAKSIFTSPPPGSRSRRSAEDSDIVGALVPGTRPFPLVAGRAASAPRSLRILFVVQQNTLLRFALLIPALADRGHEVHIAFPPGGDWENRRKRLARVLSPPQATLDLLNALCTRFPRVSYGPAPQRSGSAGWGEVASLVRGFADLAHNANPRYAGATHLRRRTKQRILGRLEKDRELEPAARWLALRLGRRLGKGTNAARSRRVLGIAARLEEAIPTSEQIDRYLRDLAPDIVVTTGTFRHVSSEVEFLKSARRLGIPSGIFVASWDNLTNKGSLKFTPERVFVWNEVQADDAVALHGIPRERVRTTGAHVFDEWFERRPSRTSEELLIQLGLDPAQPYLVYLCSSGNIARAGEHEFVNRWLEALRSSGDERMRRINVVVRPHPNVRHGPSVLGVENVVVWPAEGAFPIAADARADFYDTLAHSAAVVGINTTAMIEAAILGKSVLSVLVKEFAQETTLHFPYLVAENGGFVQVGKTLEEHVAQLGRVLDGDLSGAERSRRFVESFVRPGGLERPAAPIAAGALEELADLPVVRGARAGTRLLRVALSLEAGLSTAHASYRGLRARAQGDTRASSRLRPG